MTDGASFLVIFVCRLDGIADNGVLEHVMATTENPHRNESPTEVDRVVEVLSSVMAKKTIDKWLATPNGAVPNSPS